MLPRIYSLFIVTALLAALSIVVFPERYGDNSTNLAAKILTLTFALVLSVDSVVSIVSTFRMKTGHSKRWIRIGFSVAGAIICILISVSLFSGQSF